jgi:hypothetical protein
MLIYTVILTPSHTGHENEQPLPPVLSSQTSHPCSLTRLNAIGRIIFYSDNEILHSWTVSYTKKVKFILKFSMVR